MQIGISIVRKLESIDTAFKKILLSQILNE